mgnify:CR=1 FL=1
MLSDLNASDDMMDFMKARAYQTWMERKEAEQASFQRMERRLKEIDSELDATMEKYRQTKSEVVSQMLEQKADELAQERLRLTEKIGSKKDDTGIPSDEAFRTLFDSVQDVLKSPYETWKRGDTALKRTVTKLAFSGLVLYDRNNGFRTPNYSLPYQILHNVTEQRPVWWTQREQLRTLSRHDTPQVEHWHNLIAIMQEWRHALQEAKLAS